MNFLVDAQLPPALCGWLSDRGHDARHVVDVLAGAAPDRDLADHAERFGLILLSKDEDFLRLRLPDRFALVWVRCGNTTNRALFAWLERRWPEIERLLLAGERFIEAR